MSKKKSGGKSQSADPRSKQSDAGNASLPDRRALEGVLAQFISQDLSLESQIDPAQELIYQAFDEPSPHRQVALAREALKISQDCADAYVILAGNARTVAEALDLYHQGVVAGERGLGPERFAEFAGHFWGYLLTRPYMRAREGLAECLWEAGRCAEAADHCREMLQLNPNDNQGIRYRLAAMLFELEQHDELGQLINRYREDSADWAYAKALLEFRREGNTADARRLLVEAFKTNKHVPLYLAHIKPMPRELPDYITEGGQDEAVGYAAQFMRAWKETPGATAWLRDTLDLKPTRAPRMRRLAWSKRQQELMKLPAIDDTWEVDIRLVTPLGREMADCWMFLVLDRSSRQLAGFDFFDKRPSDAEVWHLLTDIMVAPQSGEPRRPAAICVSRKSWLRSWHNKLKTMDVECQFAESLEQVDDWLETQKPELEKLQRLSSPPDAADQDWEQIASLPQEHGRAWQAGVQQLPISTKVEGKPARPWVSLVVDVESEAVLATAIVNEEPSRDWLLSSVWQAISMPAVGEAHRPEVVYVDTDQQRDALADRLGAIGVRCVTNSEMTLIQQLFVELADHFGPRRPSLINAPGVTLEEVGELFSAAANYYDARPWRKIPSNCVIRVSCERLQSGPWYAVVMGQSGIEQGLALYEDLQFVITQLRGELSDEEAGRRMSALSFSYGECTDLAPEDLHAAEEYDWPISGPDAFPCVLRVNPGMAIRTPLKWELQLLTGCLKAIPDFVRERRSQASIPVAVGGKTWTFQLELLADPESECP